MLGSDDPSEVNGAPGMRQEAAIAYTGEEISAIREQLQRLVESRYFSQSRRYPALLKFMVEAILRGDREVLHERLIGHLLFHRSADYDTNADPVVRATAAEVRKRIAQYYHENAQKEELEIRLSSGSYIPEFVWPGKRSPSGPETPLTSSSTETLEEGETRALPEQDVPGLSATAPVPPPVHRTYTRTALVISAAIVVLTFFFVAVVHFQGPRKRVPSQVLQGVWAPFFLGNSPILICIGELGPGIAEATHQKTAEGDSLQAQFLVREAVSLSDVEAFAQFGSFLDKHGQSYRLQTNSKITFENLRETPSILVSGLDNPWTLRLLKNKRFQFGPNGSGSIIDTKGPQPKQWLVQRQSVLGNIDTDYAIAARIIEADTGRPIMIAAGIGGSGTRAASEFLTSESDLQQLGAMAPKGWEQKSFEVVLRSEVFNTIPGRPTIVGAEFW